MKAISVPIVILPPETKSNDPNQTNNPMAIAEKTSTIGKKIEKYNTDKNEYSFLEEDKL